MAGASTPNRGTLRGQLLKEKENFDCKHLEDNFQPAEMFSYNSLKFT